MSALTYSHVVFVPNTLEVNPDFKVCILFSLLRLRALPQEKPETSLLKTCQHDTVCFEATVSAVEQCGFVVANYGSSNGQGLQHELKQSIHKARGGPLHGNGVDLSRHRRLPEYKQTAKLRATVLRPDDGRSVRTGSRKTNPRSASSQAYSFITINTWGRKGRGKKTSSVDARVLGYAGRRKG